MQKADAKHDEVAVVSDELDGIQVSTSAKENSDESDAELWAGWHEDTPIIPIIWTCTVGTAMLAVAIAMAMARMGLVLSTSDATALPTIT